MQTRPPPAGFSDLRQVLPNARFFIGYATQHNFTGAALPGYGAPGAWLLDPVADELVAVADELAARGLGLVVYDSYRPRRATREMIAWCERTDNQALLDGYIARHSRHNTGNTVDLSLYRLGDGSELDMGTAWDDFGPASHTDNAVGGVLANRHLLRDALQPRGWQPYSKEWWHFNFVPFNGREPRDVPYGTHEPDEPEVVA